jgi:hypothetical protein
MKKVIVLSALPFLFALLLARGPAAAYDNDCWGQATAVFAQMGVMGEHASQEPTPARVWPTWHEAYTRAAL